MTRKIDAIYESGVFRPLQALDGLAEHTRVRVTIETVDSEDHGLAACVGILPDEDAEEMRRIIEQEFEQVRPDEW